MAIITRRYLYDGPPVEELRSETDPGLTLTTASQKLAFDVSFDNTVADIAAVDAALAPRGLVPDPAADTSVPPSFPDRVVTQGANSVVIGEGATGANDTVAIGDGADAGGPSATVIGRNASGLDQTVVIGAGCSANGGVLDGGIAIGRNLGVPANEIALGNPGATSLKDTFRTAGPAPLGDFFRATSAGLPDITIVPGAIGVFVVVNRLGVLTLDQVQVGPVNSGGAGFRLLRIPN